MKMLFCIEGSSMKIVCKLSEDGFEVEESKIINLNCKRRSNIHFGNKIMIYA